MADLVPHVGRVIRRLRAASGLSQEELAAQAGLDRTYVSSVERGQRNLSVGALSQIAEALGVYASRVIAEAEAEARGSTEEGPT